VAVGQGEGRSKKTAEQAAAEQAWLALSSNTDR
jgi:dsRNA-specific ribonuclease